MVNVLKIWFNPLNGHGTGTLRALPSAVGPQTGSSTKEGSGPRRPGQPEDGRHAYKHNRRPKVIDSSILAKA